MNFRSGWNGAENGNKIKSERWFKISTYYAIMSLVDIEFDFLCHYRIYINPHSNATFSFNLDFQNILVWEMFIVYTFQVPMANSSLLLFHKMLHYFQPIKYRNTQYLRQQLIIFFFQADDCL